MPTQSALDSPETAVAEAVLPPDQVEHPDELEHPDEEIEEPTPELEEIDGQEKPGLFSDGYFAQEDLAPLPTASLVESGPLQQYMAEISRYPLLAHDEELRLARKYREHGDLRAAYTLVVANLRLVVKIAYEFRRNFANIMDLIQEGNIGLMRAVEKFDPYRGVKLSSYAAWWIRAYIIRYVLNNWSLVKIGTTQNQRRLFFNMKKAKEELEAMGFRPEPRLLASRLQVREDEVVEMQKRLAGSDISLDAPLDQDSESSRLDFVAADQPHASDRLADREYRTLLRSKLEEFRGLLNERDRVIFDRRLLTDEPVTLRELGGEFGVSRERIRQLEADLKKRLRHHLEGVTGLEDRTV
ncbi:MAG: RNA polymerase factor sigma-32 [Deltaproteobacteria bacterium]|nr:RNA polymerase factor sigma-32 [Deltaproteobacteria bacterium]